MAIKNELCFYKAKQGMDSGHPIVVLVRPEGILVFEWARYWELVAVNTHKSDSKTNLLRLTPFAGWLAYDLRHIGKALSRSEIPVHLPGSRELSVHIASASGYHAKYSGC